MMSPTEEKVIEQILEILHQKSIEPLAVNQQSPVDTSLGLDSLDFAELAVRLESVFGRDPFSEGDVPALQTVADLAALYD